MSRLKDIEIRKAGEAGNRMVRVKSWAELGATGGSVGTNEEGEVTHIFAPNTFSTVQEFPRTINVHHDYKKLCDVLVAALDQAQSGKGRERHAAGEPFEQQEICQNTRAVGYGYPLGQARKKARESLRLLEDRGPEAAIAECLGAINYLAAAVVVMQEKGGDA